MRRWTSGRAPNLAAWYRASLVWNRKGPAAIGVAMGWKLRSSPLRRRRHSQGRHAAGAGSWNPALGAGMPDIEVVRADARLTRQDPAELATFRALRLNQWTNEVESRSLIDALVWRGIELDELPPRDGPMALGVDLGATAAFSTAATYWPCTGLEGFVACGTEPSLEKRALRDGVAGVHEAMREAGERVQLGGRVVPVGTFLAEAVHRFGRPRAFAADRWRAGELQDGVREAGLRLPDPRPPRRHRRLEPRGGP